jgi:putative ABC transport system permease protein
MTTRDLINRSARSLRNAKLRTLLTALAIAVGGFTLFLTLAAGNGVREYTSNLVSSNFDPAELIVGRDPEISNSGAPSDKPKEYDPSVTSFQGGGPNSSLQVKQITRSDIEFLEQNPDIEQVRESFNLSIRYVTREGQKKYTGSAEAYNPAQKPDLVYGDLPASGDIETGSVILPDVYLDLLGFESSAEAIGREVTVVVQQPFSLASLANIANLADDSGSLNISDVDPSTLVPEDKTYTFTVSAISRRPATSLAFGTLPLLISSTDAREIYNFTTEGTANYDQFLFVNVRVVNGEDKETRDRVKADLESDGFYVQSSEDIQKTITQFVDILQGAVAALGLITLIASIFGIINTQYISVLERTREIGLIKALGMSNKKVRLLFIFEAMWIGFIGGIIGIIAAFVLGTLLNPFITDQLNLGDGNYLIIFDFVQMIFLLLALMLVGAAAGYFPARKAAKLDPVEALRTE